MSTSFTELKQRFPIEQVAQMLGLKLKPHGVQLRGHCPICKQGDDRSFVVTPAKGVFYCFKEEKGGDILTLVASLRGCTLPEAAAFIQGAPPDKRESDGSPQPLQSSKFDAEKYFKGLDPAHEALAACPLSEATLREWKAGYSGSGVNRGRLALPIATAAGVVVGYVGMALSGEEPALKFHGLDPKAHLFGADRVTEGELTVMRDPLSVLKAHEGGIENCVAFLTETIGVEQLEVLIALMHEKKCESVAIF